MYPCRVPSGPPETDPLVALAEEASAYRAYLLVIALRILRNASDGEEVQQPLIPDAPEHKPVLALRIEGGFRFDT
jgi:hypothetical protein